MRESPSPPVTIDALAPTSPATRPNGASLRVAEQWPGVALMKRTQPQQLESIASRAAKPGPREALRSPLTQATHIHPSSCTRAGIARGAAG